MACGVAVDNEQFLSGSDLRAAVVRVLLHDPLVHKLLLPELFRVDLGLSQPSGHQLELVTQGVVLNCVEIIVLRLHLLQHIDRQDLAVPSGESINMGQVRIV